MCLSTVWTDEEMNEWLEGQPEVIEVWKYVMVRNDCYISPYVGTTTEIPAHKYRDGINISVSGPGYFFYLNKSAAFNQANFFTLPHTAIKCYVRKCNIKERGTSFLSSIMQETPSIVASQAIFPHYPETEARMEDMQPLLQKPELVPEKA